MQNTCGHVVCPWVHVIASCLFLRDSKKQTSKSYPCSKGRDQGDWQDVPELCSDCGPGVTQVSVTALGG